MLLDALIAEALPILGLLVIAVIGSRLLASLRHARFRRKTGEDDSDSSDLHEANLAFHLLAKSRREMIYEVKQMQAQQKQVRSQIQAVKVALSKVKKNSSCKEILEKEH